MDGSCASLVAGVVARSTALRRLRTADTLEVADLSAGTVLYIREITLDSTVEQTYFLLQCHLPCFGQYMQQMARYLPASWAQIPVPVILQRIPARRRQRAERAKDLQ
jgi:hypothetical protein